MIDKKTGLPELPEGYFWRINPFSVEIHIELDDTEWAEYDPFWSNYNPESFRYQYDYREVVKTREVRKWFRTKTEEYTARERREVNRSYLEVSVMSDILFPEFDRPFPSRATILPEDVLPLCEKALREWEAKKLYGDYPPKKFEGGEDV